MTPPDHAQGIDGGAEDELERHEAHVNEIPHFLVGEIAGDDAIGLGRIGEGGVPGRGADHEHFVGAGESHGSGFDADDAVGACALGIGADAFEGEVARAVEDVGEFLDFTAGQAT